MNNEMWLYPRGEPFPKGMIGEKLNQLSEFDAKHLLVDYHHNYWSLRDRIAELEGKAYALEETVNGAHPDVFDDPPF